MAMDDVLRVDPTDLPVLDPDVVGEAVNELLDGPELAEFSRLSAGGEVRNSGTVEFYLYGTDADAAARIVAATFRAKLALTPTITRDSSDGEIACCVSASFKP